MKIASLLLGCLPVTRRTAMAREAVVEQKLAAKEKQRLDDLAALKKRHCLELEYRTEKVNGLLEKIARTRWHLHPDSQCYYLELALNADVLGGMSMHRDDMQFLARMIGRQVEAEIASGHYVKSAAQEELDAAVRRADRKSLRF